MRRRLSALGALATAAFVACSGDPLSVKNTNNPSTDALLATASGTETLISKVIQQMHQGQYNSSDAIEPQANVLAYESEGTVANFGMNIRGGFPRTPIDNSPNNSVSAGNVRDFSFLTRNVVLAARSLNALAAFQSTIAPADYARDRSFAFFGIGYGLGHMSLIYDSVAVVTPSSLAASADTLVPFQSAAAANTVALAMLDSAIAVAQSADATSGSGMTIPATWLSQQNSLTRADYVRLLRSFKARIRSNVARTAAERAAVNWQSVYDDASNGIQADLTLLLGSGRGWTNAWLNQAAVPGGWHQMPYWVIGMADTSGAYDTWVRQGIGNKTPFLILTPDKRFPAGATRAAQQSAQSPNVPPPGVYFRNRPSGDDTPGAPSGLSWYDNFRYYEIRNNNTVGSWQLITRAENDMTAAEALIRLGRIPEALPLINRYRTANNLPALAGIADTVTAVPGGRACVPRQPTPGAAAATKCGNVWEAMKYEKRMETAFNGYASWFLNGRGWGDLPNGTPLEWPVPWQETNARNIASAYQNRRVSTGPGTYGFVP